MWNKNTFLLAGVVLILISTANAEVVLTLNGVDAARELADTEGKEKLVIAVGGDSEVDPNAYHIEAAGGVLQDNGGGEYSLTFEDNSSLCIVSLIANNDMIIDGTSVEEGDTIYELSLFYISETDTVISFGVNLLTEPEPNPEVEPQTVTELNLESNQASLLQAEAQPEAKPAPEPRTEIFPPSSKRKPVRRTEGINKLRYFPETSEDLSFGDWGDGDADFPTESQSGSASSPPASFKELPDGFDGSGGGMLTEGGGDYIEIDDGTVITENTVWDCNVRLLGCVEVNNAMLIIEPGVEVQIDNFYVDAITVRNNGCLIANGTPDKMIHFFPRYAYPYISYFCAILLEETASPLCEISYCQMYCAKVGIGILNKRLENPIHDNSFWDCWYGIRQIGPMLTDAVNNEVYNPTDPELMGVMYLCPIGIDVNLTDTSGVASNTAEIYIGNNTLAGWLTWGIYISGVGDPNDAGTVTIANNLITGCHDTGICLVNGYMKSLAICNGFYLNTLNMNFDPDQIFENESGDSTTVAVIEDFNSYEEAADLRAVWNDHWRNGTGATVFVYQPSAYDMLVLDGNSMRYDYNNHIPEWGYYSEANATITDLPSGIGPDWTSGDANTLTLFFYGQSDNDTGEQMYVKLTDGDEDEIDFYSIDNFNLYEDSGAMRAVWKDHYSNGSWAEVFMTGYDPNIGGPPYRSMRYVYKNYNSPYYSKAEATIGTGEGELDIESDWLWSVGAQTLSLWFWGRATNDANQKMYIMLTDGASTSAKILYNGDMNDIREEKWHQWNIPLQEFADVNDVDLFDISKIAIQFGGDDVNGINDGIEDFVVFEDIRLYAEDPPPPPPTHSVKVLYDGGDYCLAEEWWHVWNIPFTELADINLANVKSIVIGFGDGNEPYETTGAGEVYFEDVVLGNGNAENPFYDGSVYLEEDPFVNGYLGYPLFLNQGCPLIEAGTGYVDEEPYLLGKGSCRYFAPDMNSYRGIPDMNMANIGCHYFDWEYGYGPLKSDLYQDWVVNFNDFMILADGWLTTYDYNDLVAMADEWLGTVNVNPPITVTIFGDANNLNGDIGIGISDYDTTTERVFVLMDGEFVGEIVDFDDEGCVGLDSCAYGNGQHSIKAVAVDANGLITVSESTTVNFTNELYYTRGENEFEEDRDYSIFAMCSSGQNLRVKVVDWNDTVVWTSPIISGDINLAIPESVFSGQLYGLVIEEESGYYAMDEGGGAGEDESWESIWERSIGKPYEPSISYRFAIFLPNGRTYFPWFSNSADTRKRTVAEIVRACETKHMPYIVLYKGQCTWENFNSVLSSPGISYAYMVAHGGSHVGPVNGQVQRTFFKLTDSLVLSYYDEDLPERIKKRKDVHYMSYLGLGATNRMRIVQIDACAEALFDDMAREWIDMSEPVITDQLFISWNAAVGEDDDWDIWGRDIWYKLGDGTTNYYNAQKYAESKCKKPNLIIPRVAAIGWNQVTFTSEGNQK